MFLGQYRHGVDAKGRVAVPAPFRRYLPEGSVISIGPESRLVLRPPAEWEKLVSRFRMTSETPAAERAYIRQLYASARELEMDAQGRVLLDAEHRRFAQIGDRAVFVGVGNVVELVGSPIWDKEQAGVDPDHFTVLGDSVHSAGGLQ